MLNSLLRLLGIIILILLIPALIILCLPFDPNRNIYFFFMRLFGRSIVKSAGIALRVEGKENPVFDADEALGRTTGTAAAAIVAGRGEGSEGVERGHHAAGT